MHKVISSVNLHSLEHACLQTTVSARDEQSIKILQKINYPPCLNLNFFFSKSGVRLMRKGSNFVPVYHLLTLHCSWELFDVLRGCTWIYFYYNIRLIIFLIGFFFPYCYSLLIYSVHKMLLCIRKQLLVAEQLIDIILLISKHIIFCMMKMSCWIFFHL